MANFFDAVTGVDITSIQVRKGAKYRIGLYGGGPPPKYERLNVTTDPNPSGDPLKQVDPAVTFVKEAGSWRFIYEIDPAKMKSQRIRACVDGYDYSAAVTVLYVSTQEIRTSIVTLARTFVATAHYLWGTAGNQPGVGNGNAGGGKTGAAKMRDPGLDPKETARDKVLAVCTAVQPLFDGYNTCAGRSGRYHETPDLAAFLNACQEEIKKGNTDQTKWQGAGSQKNLFPRKYYFRNSLTNPQKEVWGESCAGIRHFDCVGLVNYCYARHWYQPSFGMDIAAFRIANSGMVPVTKDNDLMDADVLIKPGNGHIAMLYGKGTNWFVVQASETITGLTDSEAFNPKSWDRYRMQDAYLRGLHDT